MDPFEVRMQFLNHLRRLNASQQSIQRVVGFAVKYFPTCGEDLWDCIVEESQKVRVYISILPRNKTKSSCLEPQGSINSRINILYFLDSLCETCLLVESHSSSQAKDSNLYVSFVPRDLGKIVENVVPQGRQGLPNLVSTKQVTSHPLTIQLLSNSNFRKILESWRSKRVIDPQTVDGVLTSLNARQSASSSEPPEASSTSHAHVALPRNEIFKRIEEDRERHKRLRERRWVQPVTRNPASHHHPPLASFIPLTTTGDGAHEQSIDIEFENEWETTSDWNEDDIEAATEEAELCFPAEGEGPMDLS
ncbi:hypothetical protein H0H81_002085 [Sphagnurus paluster]|uniref:CID domain-containing protein n=1 Tax=Sphagnurus paluster TaxID=117069 RepID=A0A9P7K4L8_9AGAR|nr:hypothetical protein H0H81_002085 [Sphagnurus paluster]